MRVLFVSLIGLGLGILLCLLFWTGDEVGGALDAAPHVADALPTRSDTEGGLQGRGLAAAGDERADGFNGTAVIKAQVLDRAGEPLAGVPVALHAFERKDRFSWRPAAHAAEQFMPPKDHALVETRASGADGWVHFQGLDVRRGYELRALPEPPYYGAQATVFPTNSTVPPVLMLGKGVPIRVRVVDAEGKGVAAYVTALIAKEADHRNWSSTLGWKLPSTATEPDGRLKLGAVPERRLAFSVFVPGRGARNGIEVEPPFDNEINLEFEYGGGPHLFGMVRDSTGRPVPGARLIAQVNPRGAQSFELRYQRVAQTNSSGAYSIRNLAPGYLTSVSVHAPGYIYLRTVAPFMEVAEGQELEIDVTLFQGGIVEGTVRDPEGKPIPGARIMAATQGTQFWNSRGTAAVSDESGHYRIENVPLGKGQLGAFAEGFYAKTPEGVKLENWNAPPVALFEVTAEGERLSRDISLLRGVPVTGQVLDAAGAPVLGARVTANSSINWRMQAFDQYATQRTTDAEGQFTYTGLPPGHIWKFQAFTQDGRSKSESRTLAIGDEPKPVALELEALGGIRGVVTTSDEGRDRPFSIRIRRQKGGAKYTITSRADGAFEQRGLAEGLYDVYATDGLGRKVGNTVTVDVKDGVWSEGIKIPVEKLEAILGRLVDLEGKAVAGIQVQLSYKQGGRSNSTNNMNTRVDGRFAWRDLLPGDYEIRIAGEQERHYVRIGEAEQKYLYIVKPKEVVQGTVVGPDGAPVAGGTVRIRRRRGKRGSSTANATIVNGRFRGEAPTGDGEITLTVSGAVDPFGRKLNVLPYTHEDYRPAAGPIEIKLEGGLMIKGRVVGPSGQGVPHMGIHIQRESRDGRRWYGYYYSGYRTSIRTDENGGFEKHGLNDGNYEVYVQTGGTWMQPEPTPVSAGSADTVIRLEKGLAVSGRVVDAEGVGIAQVNVTFAWNVKDGRNRNRGMSRSAKTEADGSFRIEGLPMDARGQVSASPPTTKGKQFIAATEQNVSSGDAGLLLALVSGGYIEGIVQGPAGEPVGRMRVRAEQNVGGRWQARRTARSANNGTFKLGPVAPGVYRLRVDARGDYTASEPIEVRGPVGELVLLVPRGLPIKGKVLGEDVRRFQVTWSYPNGQGGWATKTTTTAKDGSFRINQSSDAPGTLLIRRHGDERYALWEQVRASDGPFEVTLLMGLTIRGHVENLPGQFRRGWVSAKGSLSTTFWGALEPDGTFEVRGLPDGVYNMGGRVDRIPIGGRSDVAAGAQGIKLVTSGN